MPLTKSKQTIRLLCADVRSRFVDDFLERMDDDYFETFTPEEIAEHLHMSSAIDPDQQPTVKIEALPHGEFKIVIVG